MKYLAAIALLLALPGIGQAADLTHAGQRGDAALNASAWSDFNWNGHYLGGLVGYGWGRYEAFDLAHGLSLPPVDVAGPIGGATLGINKQYGALLLGLEADIQNGPTGTRPQGTIGNGFSCGTGACFADVQYFGTVRPRVGLVADRWLVFATGGYAFGGYQGGIKNAPNAIGSGVAQGWTVGGGIEYGLPGGWTTRVDYLYVDLGDLSFGTVGGFPLTARGNFSVVRAGLTYRFGQH